MKEPVRITEETPATKTQKTFTSQVVILSIIWAIVVSLIGSFLVLGFLKGLSNSSFILFMLPFLIFGLIIGFIAALPFFMFAQRLTEKPQLERIAKVLGIIFVLLPSFHLLYNVGLLSIGLTPIPSPPDALTPTYKYQDTGIGGVGLGSSEAILNFHLDESLSIEEKVTLMEGVARFYDDFAKKRYGHSEALSDYPTTKIVSCEQAVNNSYQWYKKSINLGYSHPSIWARCKFKGWLFRFNLNLREDGGIITLPSYSLPIP